MRIKTFSEDDVIKDQEGKTLYRFLTPAEYNDHYYIVCAEEMISGRKSLLKFVHTSDNTSKINNLTREGNFCFSYPYIEQVYGNFRGVDADGDQVFGVEVEYVEGKNLTNYRQMLEQKVKDGSLSREQCERIIFRQILQFLFGMSYYTSYAKKIYLQRDLKPDNIMITPDEQVKIIDFDVAHLSGSTKTMHLSGWDLGFSMGYTSPDLYSLICQHKGQDIYCEIYSAGRLCFYWLNGVRYYTEEQCSRPKESTDSTLEKSSVDYMFSAPYCMEQELAYGITGNQDRILKHYLQPQYRPFLRILDKMCASPDSERYEHVEEIIQDMKAFLLAFCGHSRKKLAEYLQLPWDNLLLGSGDWTERKYIPFAYAIDGKKEGKPLYENAVQDICLNGKCILTVYNLNGQIYYLNGPGIVIKQDCEDYLLKNGNKLICSNMEIEFWIGEEVSC